MQRWGKINEKTFRDRGSGFVVVGDDRSNLEIISNINYYGKSKK